MEIEWSDIEGDAGWSSTKDLNKEKTTTQRKLFEKYDKFEDAEFKQTDLELFLKTYNLTSLTIDILGPNDGGYFGEATLGTSLRFGTLLLFIH